MAFGMMQAKWGILQRPLGCSMNNMLWLVQAIARLHNYCINEHLAASMDPFDIPDHSIPRYVPSVPHNHDGDPIWLDGRAFEGINDGHSFLREWMVNRVHRKQLKRPAISKKRTIEETT